MPSRYNYCQKMIRTYDKLHVYENSCKCSFLSTSNINTARLMDTKMSFILGLCLTLLIDISLSSAFDLDCLSVAKIKFDLGCLSGTKGKRKSFS